MQTLTDQYGAAWQLSSLGVGAVAIGMADIRQCIDYILRTRKGQDPFRPLFGSNVFDYVDKPFPIARPNISKEITEGFGIWEPRIKIQSVKSALDKVDFGNIKFFITYTLVDQNIEDMYVFNTNATQQSGNSGQLILQCIVPESRSDNDSWFVQFIGNNNEALPSFPSSGFPTIDAMVAWIQSNWSSYGKWYYSGNKLVVYIKSGVFSSASLSCYINTSFVLKALIPQLDISQDEFYLVNFLPNNSLPSPDFPDGINNAGDLLSWVQNNWGSYGSWTISNGYLVLTATGAINGILSITSTNPIGGFSLGFDKGFNV